MSHERFSVVVSCKPNASSSLWLIRFLLRALGSQHHEADERGGTAEEQHQQHGGDGDGVVVRQEEPLDLVVLVNERLRTEAQSQSMKQAGDS